MNLFLFLIGLIIIVLIAAKFWQAITYDKATHTHRLTYPKGEIIKRYRADDKTFKKWLIKLMPDFAGSWTRKRTFSAYENFMIECALGDPCEQSAMNRNKILKVIATDEQLPRAAYRHLRQQLAAIDLGINLKGMSEFPPRVADAILKALRGEDFVRISIVTV